MISRGRWSAPGKSRSKRGRGVSDVVGTILLLALTVTLFASIFFFVDTFPTPPPATANQFQAGLSYGSSGTAITAVNIVHLAGPTLAGNGVLIYLYSAKHPTRFTAPYHISDGRNGTNTWALGQGWSLNVTNKTLTVPDNITISIATQTQLLFRVTLPGQNPQVPPMFVNYGTNPSPLGIGQGFTIFAQIVDPNLKTNSVYVNVSQIPGLSGTSPKLMTYTASTNLFTYTIASGVTNKQGTFYALVNASDSNGLVNAIAVPIIITSAQVTQASIALSAQPALPVKGSATTLNALVTNPGASSTTATVTFYAGATLVGTESGTVGGGASASFPQSWTPTSTGPTIVTAVANLTGGLSVTGTLNLTVYPKILFIAHNVLSGAKTTYNESAYLAQSLVSAGVPFTSMFVACNAGLPASSTFNGYGVVIIDFGSNPSAGCSAVSTTEQAKITGASTSVNFWIVGLWAFDQTTCASYSAAFFNLAGLTGGGGAGTCVTLETTATAPVTWTQTAASGLRADGIPAGLAINKTLSGSSAFEPYGIFPKGATHAFFTTSAGTVGTWLTAASGQRTVALATDPALLSQTMPNGNSWVDNAAGTIVAYNIVNYLCGLASASTPGRGLTDYGIGGIYVYGTSHTAQTTVYAELRNNGPVASLVTVTLYINGSAALYNGIIVSYSTTVAANGGTATAVLIWQAPGGGSYTISVEVTPTDLNPLDQQLPASILNQPTKIA